MLYQRLITIIYSLWLCFCRLVQSHLFTFYKNRLQFFTCNTTVIYYLYTIRYKLLTEINHWIRMYCFIWFGNICPYQTKLDMDLKLITIVSKLTPSLYILIVQTMCFKLFLCDIKKCEFYRHFDCSLLQWSVLDGEYAFFGTIYI